MQVKVSAFLKFPFQVIPKNRMEIIKELAVVRIEAPATMQSHIPINLVVVLDISSNIGAPSSKKSSMLDALKKSIKFIIKLLDNRDCLTILTFGERVKISIEDWASAEKKVDKLVVGQYTWPRSGLEEAVQVYAWLMKVDHENLFFLENTTI